MDIHLDEIIYVRIGALLWVLPLIMAAKGMKRLSVKKTIDEVLMSGNQKSVDHHRFVRGWFTSMQRPGGMHDLGSRFHSGCHY